MRNKLIGVVIVMMAAFDSSAQESEPGGIWTSLSLEKNITKKWALGSELEFRTNGLSWERNRFAAQIGTDYELFNNFKLGASYNWMNVDDDYKWSDDSTRTDYFQNRHRFNLQGVWRYKLGNVAFQIRERGQATFKDDSDRIKSNGKINENRINPEYVWRNRIKVSYNKKKMPWTPYVSFESYYLLNDPDPIRYYNSAATAYEERSSYFSKVRYTLGLEYKINKQHAVELFGMYSHERGNEEIEVMRARFSDDGLFESFYLDKYRGLTSWTDDYVLGIGYTISF